MQQTVITIVSGTEGALTEAVTQRAAALAKGVGVDNVVLDALAPGRALDVVVAGQGDALTAALRGAFQALPGFDVFVQPVDIFRKKRLLLADMDATMIVGETLDELAAQLGLRDQVAPVTEAAMRGDIDFAEALRQRVALLKDMPLAVIFEAIDDVRYAPGAAVLVKTMSRHDAKCVLISGGFDFFTRHVAGVLGFYKNIGNSLEIQADRLTGNVIPPIVDKDVKRSALLAEAKQLKLDTRHVMAVGDGANDIPMLQAAGVGVGYFGKPAVAAATPFQVRHSDLTALLFMQGYRRAQFVG